MTNVTRHLEIEAEVDRRGIEAIRLQLAALAKSYGLELKTLSLTRLETEPTDSSSAS